MKEIGHSGSGRVYDVEAEGRVIRLKKPIKHEGKGRPVHFLVEFEGKRYTLKQFNLLFVPKYMVCNVHIMLMYKRYTPLECIILHNKHYKPSYIPDTRRRGEIVTADGIRRTKRKKAIAINKTRRFLRKQKQNNFTEEM